MRVTDALNTTTVPVRVLRQHLHIPDETPASIVILAAAEKKNIERHTALRELRRVYIRRGILPRYAADACEEFLREEQEKVLLNGQYVEWKNDGGMQ